MDMIDSGESDAKIIAVPVGDPRFSAIKDLKDLNAHIVKEFTHFFETYKHIQGKVVKIKKVEGASKAKKVIEEAIKLYKKEYKKK
jgi:inorganic pyrophosphatase